MAKKKKQAKNSSKNLMWLTALTVIVIAAGVFYFAGKQGSGNDKVFRNVTVSDLKNATEADKLILDVRTTGEYDQGHIEGSAQIAVQELEGRLNEISDYKDKPIYVYCHTGNRSLVASEILQKNGFKDIRNVKGGTEAWLRAGYTLVR